MNVLPLGLLVLLIGCGNGDATDSAPPACEEYLQCTLAARPEVYAAELFLYGDKSACWTSDENAANCERACTANRQSIGADCQCDAQGTCTAVALSPGTYRVINASSSASVYCDTVMGTTVNFATARYSVSALVNSKNPYMTLNIQVPNFFSMNLTGTITMLKGSIADTFSTSSADVTITGRDTFMADVEFSGERFRCDEGLFRLQLQRM